MLILWAVPTYLFANKINPPIVFPQAEFINANTTRIPFKVVDQLIVVEAELLNKKGNFIIDTGAETLILNSQHFKTFSLKNKDGEETYGVNGTIETVKEKFIKSLSINDLNLNKLNADVVNLSHFERIKRIDLLGIIGFSILKNFEVFIDMHLNQITLSCVDKDGEKLSERVYAEKIHDSISFKLKKHTIIIDGFIGGRPVKMGIDTGAEYNQLRKNIDKVILGYFYGNKKLKLTGASGKSIQVLAGKLYRFQLKDSIYFGPMKTVVADLKKMNGAFRTHLDGVLGFEFFKQKRTIINYKKQKLYFIKNPLLPY